jgi:hypothetical protein
MIRYFLVFSIGLLLGGLIWKSGYDSGIHDRVIRNKSKPSDLSDKPYIDNKVRVYKI